MIANVMPFIMSPHAEVEPGYVFAYCWFVPKMSEGQIGPFTECYFMSASAAWEAFS